MYLGAERHKKDCIQLSSTPPSTRGSIPHSSSLVTRLPLSPAKCWQGSPPSEQHAGQHSARQAQPAESQCHQRVTGTATISVSTAQVPREAGETLCRPHRKSSGFLLASACLFIYFFFKQTSIINLLLSDISQIKVLRKIFYTLQLLLDN